MSVRAYHGWVTRRFLRRTLLLAGCAFPLVAAAAYGGGGTTFSNAPIVQYGQQEFGDTTTLGFNNGGDSIWRAPLVAGDRVTVDWETSVVAGPNAYDPGIPVVQSFWVMPPGTNDFNASDDKNVFTDGINSGTKKRESVFTPTSSGTYYFVFESSDSDDGGPFDFVAFVRHRVVLRFLRAASISRTGRLTVTVNTPDGHPISNGLNLDLYATWNGRGHRLATAKPSAGRVNFHLKLPKAVVGESVRFRIIAHGADFIAATSQGILTINR